jgi:hypothetical protein
MNVYCKRVFLYRLSPETFGYTLVYVCLLDLVNDAVSTAKVILITPMKSNIMIKNIEI